MEFPSDESVLKDLETSIPGPSAVSTPEPVETSPVETTTPVETEAPAQAVTPEEQKILDLKELVKDQKFKLDDKEFTLDDLKKHMMRDADYRRKTQEIASIKKEHESLKGEQKYWDNLQHDLALVKANPHLADQFKQTYPDKFHQFVAEYAPQENQFSEAAMMQKVQSLVEKTINPLRESILEREKQATIAEWSSWEAEVKSRYPSAQPKVVQAILNQALSEGTPPSKELWEQAYKLSHDEIDGLKKQWLSENVQKTKTLNNQAKDVKPGGSIASPTKRNFSLSEASENLARELGVSL